MTRSTLPYDYSRCLNNECPLRMECLRYTDRPDVVLSYTKFNPENKTNCTNLIKNDHKTNK